jgi:hypothetical protein
MSDSTTRCRRRSIRGNHRSEPPLPPRRDHGLDGARADVAHGAEAEADPGLPHDGELETGLVDVWREDFQSQLARLVDVLHDLVGAADF